MQLVIDTAQTKLTVKDKCFYIASKTIKRQISPKRLSSIAITSNVLVSAAAMMLAAQNQVPIHYYNYTGHIMATVRSPYFRNLVSLRKQQIVLFDSTLAVEMAVQGLNHKLNLQKELLVRLAHSTGSSIKQIPAFVKDMTTAIAQLEVIKRENENINACRNEIMGIEGSMARKYWSAVSLLLPEGFQFKARTRQPAKDKFNAALNYLYGMTYARVENAIFATGLDPMAGYFHTENYRKTSLVFDIIEPFRPVIDQLLIGMCKAEELQEEDFETDGVGYSLGKKGKKKIIPAFNDYMLSRIKFDHQIMSIYNHILSYTNTIAQTIKNYKS